MARKQGKNSRAARQGALAEATEVKDLENLPRAEKTDLANILIRTAARNEALLDAKISKKKNSKNKINKVSLKQRLSNATNSMDKDRLERALNISNRLDGKIAKSISRARYVQHSRKAGWDLINNTIKQELSSTKEDEKLKNPDTVDESKIQEEEIELELDYDKGSKTSDFKANMFALLENDVDN